MSHQRRFRFLRVFNFVLVLGTFVGECAAQSREQLEIDRLDAMMKQEAIRNQQERTRNERIRTFDDLERSAEKSRNQERMYAEVKWNDLMAQGKRSAASLKYDAAAIEFAAAVKVAESFGRGDVRIAESETALGKVLLAAGKHAEAEQHYKRATEVMEKLFGANDPRYGASLNNMATLLLAMQRYSEAESLIRKALTIIERALGPGHIAVASLLTNYSILLHQLQRDSEAGEMLQRASAIREASKRERELYEKHRAEFPEAHRFLDAVTIGDEKVVQEYIARKTLLNAQDEKGETALMIAAEFGHEEIVKLLLNAGADVQLRNTAGASALDKAKATKDNKKVVNLLTKSIAQANR